MKVIDYTFHFPAITEKRTTVKVNNHFKKQEFLLETSIKDEVFVCREMKNIPEEVSDLIDIAYSAYFADRYSTPSKNGFQKNILVKLPLRKSETYNDTRVKKKLEQILNHFTGDSWTFKFTERKGKSRSFEDDILFGSANDNSEIAQWSGGLDSLAGLLTRYSENPKKTFRLLGLGTNVRVIKNQKEIVTILKQKLGVNAELTQIVQVNRLNSGVNRNNVARTRGFLFLVIGLVFAFINKKKELFVYENGIGAFNLPLLGGTYSDYSKAVNPSSISLVSNFVSSILQTKDKFLIMNPFLFETKAALMRKFKDKKYSEIIQTSISCDRINRKTNQCGICANCILRRQSLLANRINDLTVYQNKTPLNQLEGEVINPTILQLDRIESILKTKNKWGEFCNHYYILDDYKNHYCNTYGLNSEAFQNNTIKLYERYIQEWKSILNF